MHARNGENADPGAGYEFGNPFSLLKLQRARLDPLGSSQSREQALKSAVELGLSSCVDCPGCKCGVGIDLKNLVVSELLTAAGDRLPEPSDLSEETA
jgi:hypothetical protein